MFSRENKGPEQQGQRGVQNVSISRRSRSPFKYLKIQKIICRPSINCYKGSFAPELSPLCAPLNPKNLKVLPALIDFDGFSINTLCNEICG